MSGFGSTRLGAAGHLPNPFKLFGRAVGHLQAGYSDNVQHRRRPLCAALDWYVDLRLHIDPRWSGFTSAIMSATFLAP